MCFIAVLYSVYKGINVIECNCPIKVFPIPSEYTHRCKKCMSFRAFPAWTIVWYFYLVATLLLVALWIIQQKQCELYELNVKNTKSVADNVLIFSHYSLLKYSFRMCCVKQSPELFSVCIVPVLILFASYFCLP